MKRFKIEGYIFFLLLSAFLFRVPGIIDGLPAVYNSTEHFLARTALSMGASKTIDPGFYIYPTLYTYLLLIIYGCIYLMGSLLGVFQTQYDFAVQFLTDPTVLYLVSRLINVILSLTTIYITYIFLRKSINDFTAKLSAAFMGISFYMIRFSGFATADTLLILFSMLCTLFLYRLMDFPKIKYVFFAGIFCGLAIGTKYNAGFLFAGLSIAIIYNWWKQNLNIFSAFGISLCGLAVGFFVTNPLWLIYPERFYQGWLLVSSQMYSAVSAERGLVYLWEIRELIQTEMVIGVLFVVATIYYIFYKEYRHYPALIVILLTFFYVGSWTKKGIDYLFAVFPAWIILSASFVDHIAHTYIRKRKYRNYLLVLIFLPSFLVACHQFILYLNQDTREQASEWMVKSLHKEQIVCYDNYHNDLGVFDIQRYISYGASADQLPEAVKQRLKSFSTDPRQINFIPILIMNSTRQTNSGNAYEQLSLKYRRRNLDELMDQGTSILITNNWYYESHFSIDLEVYPPGVQEGIKDVQLFYQALHERFKPIKVFEPSFLRPGPKLSIYDFNQ